MSSNIQNDPLTKYAHSRIIYTRPNKEVSMTRKILVTAIKWSPDRFAPLEKLLRVARKKYDGDIVVIVSYTAPGLAIAAVASAAGIPVQMYAQDVNLNPQALEISGGITVTSSPQPSHMQQMVKAADGIMALDKGDPIALIAAKMGKKVWTPTL